MVNNSIAIKKLLFTGSGLNVLCDDGVYRKNPISTAITFNGSLANVSCNILMIYQNASLTANDASLYNPYIIGYNGNTANIKITVIYVPSGTTNQLPVYDSQYDCIFYCAYDSPTNAASNLITVLDAYYNAGKGVVISAWTSGNYYNFPLAKRITSATTSINDSTAYVLSNSGFTYGLGSYMPNNRVNLTAYNGSTNIGGNSFYLDDLTGKGRRVDLCQAISPPSMSANSYKLILLSCLWAARRIN